MEETQGPDSTSGADGAEVPVPEVLRRSFGLATIDPASLSPWSSVHRGTTAAGQDIVVKRTAETRERAMGMAAWTRALAEAGVPTVTPVRLDAANPRALTIDGASSWWVVYPFCPGAAYIGRSEQIVQAGDLLGRLHASPPPEPVAERMRQHSWPQTPWEEVAGDLDTLDEILGEHGGQSAEEARGRLHRLGRRWWEESLPGLREADARDPLPRTGATGDYKAANLVFGADEPIVVDPDNGGVEPRICDLALALILFHHECPSAPARVLTPAEWRDFAGAYLDHVALTDRERELWPRVLDHLLWEEGTWAVEDADAQDWGDPRQGAQLRDLALLDPRDYPLP